MSVADICRIHDLSVQAAEKALSSMQAKGLVTGFVPSDLHAQITPTDKAAVYKN